MAKGKDIKLDQMVNIKPLTENQKKAFKSYKDGKNLFLYGAAGTGKTFVALFNGLQDVLRNDSPYDSCQAMRKIRQHCFKSHIRTWLSSCLRCRAKGSLELYTRD